MRIRFFKKKTPVRNMISDCASHSSMAYIIWQVSLRLSGKASGKKVPRQTHQITWEASEKCRFPESQSHREGTWIFVF